MFLYTVRNYRPNQASDIEKTSPTGRENSEKGTHRKGTWEVPHTGQ